MSTSRYTINKKAVEDLEKIWLYTFNNWSVEQADRYYNLIIDKIEFVAKNNNSGKSMEHIKKGYRAIKIKSHLIFYRKSNDKKKIVVVRILHQMMDVENRL